LIIQQRPDIIQAWGWHSLCVATTATVRKNIPLVAVDTALPRRSSFMQRWLFRQARRVALPVGSVDSRTAVIPWCVAPPAPSDRRTMRESLELPADSPTVLIADPIKIGFGWRESLQVFDILSHVYPNIRLLVASDGPEFGSMQEFAGKLGLRSVHYLGWRHDLTAVIEASDAVLILGDRGGRNLALQSLASGAAIVACDRPDLRALLADTAVFVAAGDMHGAAVAARQAIDNPRGAELVQRQRELAASYSPDRIAQVWSNLYDSISTSSHVTA
jgi:glycosyltransferase involved in cell wall biosynthesis